MEPDFSVTARDSVTSLSGGEEKEYIFCINE